MNWPAIVSTESLEARMVRVYEREGALSMNLGGAPLRNHDDGMPTRVESETMPPGALREERDVREAYAAHAGELYGFAVRSLGDSGLAEEAVQETFLRAWRAGERFDPQIGSLRTWLFAILRNVVIDLGRARASRPRVAEGGIEPSVEPLDEALLGWQMEEAMRRIGEQHRRVLVETYYRGRPYAEVAKDLGVPEGTVKSRVYYGLRALRVALEEIGYDG
jgi:RNA polymerase sigma-70 factor (ECF subfamily)